MSTCIFLQDNDCESTQEWGHSGSPGLRSGEQPTWRVESASQQGSFHLAATSLWEPRLPTVTREGAPDPGSG